MNVFTPVSEIQKLYPGLSPEKIKETIKNFKKYDLNGDGSLDQFEVNCMMEKLGQTKTHLELREMIGEAAGGKEVISFEDFLRLVGGPGGLDGTSFGRIYKSSLAKLAAFHEDAIKKAAGPPAKSKEQIEAEKLEKKLKMSQSKAKSRAAAASRQRADGSQ